MNGDYASDDEIAGISFVSASRPKASEEVVEVPPLTTKQRRMVSPIENFNYVTHTEKESSQRRPWTPPQAQRWQHATNESRGSSAEPWGTNGPTLIASPYSEGGEKKTPKENVLIYFAGPSCVIITE